MNHSKIILLACISGFVALTTAKMGVTGTIIGSVISSLLYNILAELLEKPVTDRKFSFNFEYEIAYVFPLIVIAFIQLSLLAALLSEMGYLPGTFLHAYLTIQGAVDNNLYRILGCALLVMGVYPFIIRPNIVKKSYGVVIAFIGLIFLARGFLDSNLPIIHLYEKIFAIFDFPIEVFAFFVLVIIILLILNNASENHREFKASQKSGIDIGKTSHPVRGSHDGNGPRAIRIRGSQPQMESRVESKVAKKYHQAQKNQHYGQRHIRAVKNPKFEENQYYQEGRERWE